MLPCCWIVDIAVALSSLTDILLNRAALPPRLPPRLLLAPLESQPLRLLLIPLPRAAFHPRLLRHLVTFSFSRLLLVSVLH